MQGLRPANTEPKAPALPIARAAARGAKESAAVQALVQTPAPAVGGSRRRPARDAWSVITTPLRSRKGARLVVYGITGKGKTTGVKNLLAFMRAEQLVDLTLIHDVKFRERAQYDGQILHDPRDVFTPEHAPHEYPATVVLRKRGLDHMPSVDQAARVTLESADSGVTTLLVVDEFSRAIEEDIVSPDGKSIPFHKGSTNRIVSEGLGLGASLIALKQLPQNMPTGVRSQADLVFFGVHGDGITHLLDEKVINKPMAEAIARLRVGEFLFKPCEGDCNPLDVHVVPAP